MKLLLLVFIKFNQICTIMLAKRKQSEKISRFHSDLLKNEFSEQKTKEFEESFVVFTEDSRDETKEEKYISKENKDIPQTEEWVDSGRGVMAIIICICAYILVKFCSFTLSCIRYK
ncbi:hypothetical protein NGRA_1757 [Nosema granulosis]|uniref:Uncharacterized protein n=1 Tax=Nosema granulosis TaxID=83296 RepID=A0A9P6GYA4_9MICR|nr:hypothetical protein NGRA_1757 [Nosema granulosis]